VRRRFIGIGDAPVDCHFADCPDRAEEHVPGFGDYCAHHAVIARRSADRIPTAAPTQPDPAPDPTEPAQLDLIDSTE